MALLEGSRRGTDERGLISICKSSPIKKNTGVRVTTLMSDLSRFHSRFKRNQAVWTQRRHTRGRPAPRAHIALQRVAFHGRYVTMATPHTAQHVGGNGNGYDDATSEIYDFFVTIQAFNLLTVGDRAICPRPLPRATQSVPRACIVDLKLASASASA